MLPGAGRSCCVSNPCLSTHFSSLYGRQHCPFVVLSRCVSAASWMRGPLFLVVLFDANGMWVFVLKIELVVVFCALLRCGFCFVLFFVFFGI